MAYSNALRRLHVAILSAAAAVVLPTQLSHAANTIYLLDSGLDTTPGSGVAIPGSLGTPASELDEAIRNLKAVYGSDAQIVQINAANAGSASINGVPVRLKGSNESVVNWGVVGDLNLHANDVLVGVGPKMMRVTVANNANLSPSAVIDVSAHGRIAGSGGGNGGKKAYDEIIVNRAFKGLGGAGGYTPRNPDSAIGQDGADGATPSYVRFSSPQSGRNITINEALSAGTGIAGVRGMNDYLSDRGLPGPAVTYTGPALVTTVGKGGRGSDGTFTADGGRGHDNDNIVGASATAGGDAIGTGEFFRTDLRAGSGGASGGDGGSGGFGTDGGGGGGGFGFPPTPFGGGRPGANGGNGGLGNAGGQGGDGGIGGGGGGALNLEVRGALNLEGVTVSAAGASGRAGAAGGEGGFGMPGQPGTPLESGDGGDGGRGGTGGNGGRGGRGSGGDIQISSATLYRNTSTTLNSAGSVDGRIWVANLGGNAPVNRTGAFAGSGFNPYRSYFIPGGYSPDDPKGLGSRDGQTSPSATPNLSSLDGGAASFGRIESAEGVADTAIATALAAKYSSKPSNAIAVVTRTSTATGLGAASAVLPGYDALLVSSLGRTIENPALALVNTSDVAGSKLVLPNAVVPTGLVPLRLDGWKRDAEWVDGATGPVELTELGANQSWGTLVEQRGFATTINSTQYGETRSFSTADLMRDGTPLYIRDTGLLKVNVAMRSQGGSQSATVFSAGGGKSANFDTGNGLEIRAGASQTVRLTVTNNGMAGSLLNGSLNDGRKQQTYTNLPTTGSSTFDTTINAPTNAKRGDFVDSPLFVEFKNTFDDTGVSTFYLGGNARVVGPLPQYTGLTTDTATSKILDLGTVDIGDTATKAFGLTNANTTAAFSPELTDLSILLAGLTSNPGGFRFSSLATDTVLSNGEQAAYFFSFTPTRMGTFEATFLLATDENAAYGQFGTTTNITIQATAVPEPVSLAVLGAAGLVGLRRRRC